MIGDSPHPRPPRSRLLQVVGLLAIASGILLAVFASLTWGPMHEDEWPGFVPVIVVVGSGLLVLLGARLWTGPGVRIVQADPRPPQS